MAQSVICRPFIANAWVRSPVIPRDTCNLQTGPESGIFPQYSAFPLSVPFHHCFTIIFISIPLLSEGQMSDAWEPSNTAQFFLIFGSFGQKRALLSFIRSVNSVQACSKVFETIARILRSDGLNLGWGSSTFE